MKILLWGTGIVVLVAALFFGLQILASERVEVVELHVSGAGGATETTRLWIVDDEGYQYLRSSSGSSGWLPAVMSGDTFTLTRDGNTRAFTAIPRTDKRDVVNRLMQEKYGWGNSFIKLLTGGATNAVPMELHSTL